MPEHRYKSLAGYDATLAILMAIMGEGYLDGCELFHDDRSVDRIIVITGIVDKQDSEILAVLNFELSEVGSYYWLGG